MLKQEPELKEEVIQEIEEARKDIKNQRFLGSLRDFKESQREIKEGKGIPTKHLIR